MTNLPKTSIIILIFSIVHAAVGVTEAKTSPDVSYTRCLPIYPHRTKPCYDKNGRDPDPSCKVDCYCVDTCYCQYANLEVTLLQPHVVTFGWNLSKPGCSDYDVHNMVLSTSKGQVWKSLVRCKHTDLIGECTTIGGPINPKDFPCPQGHCELSIPVKTKPCSGCLSYTLILSRYHINGIPSENETPGLIETANFPLCSKEEVIPAAPRVGMQELAPAILKKKSNLPRHLSISWNSISGPCVAGYRVSWEILGTKNGFHHYRTIQQADHRDLAADVTDLKIELLNVTCSYPKYSVSVQAITPKGRLGEAKVISRECSRDHFIADPTTPDNNYV